MTIPTLQDFLNDVKNHELIIHKDDGIYRHITLRDPKTINLLFNITTFPDYLVITGDMGTITFSRVDDMFKFFRNDELNINPNYWAEKIQAIEYKVKNHHTASLI